VRLLLTSFVALFFLNVQIYDPEGTGYVDTDVLKAIFEQLGYGPISEEDMQVLIEIADADGDGKISIDDWAFMMDHKYVDGSGGIHAFILAR